MTQRQIPVLTFASPERKRELYNIKRLGIPRTQRDWQANYIRDPGETDDWCDYWVQSVAFSPTATAVNRRIRDFVGGKGFTDDKLGDKLVNKEDTLLDLHEKIVQDFALWGRFAIRVMPSKGGNKYTVYHINAEWVRYEWADENSGLIKACYVLPFINSSEDKNLMAERLPLWNGQDSFSEGIEFKNGKTAWRFKGEEDYCDYKGHIFFYNPAHASNRVYSRPDLYSAEKDILADGRIGEALERITANQFMIGGILTLFGDPNERIKDNQGNDTFQTVGSVMNKNLKDQFSGSSNGGTIMVLWSENPDEIPNLQPYQVGNLHEMLNASDDRIRGRIAMAGQIPEVLLGVQQAGSLGQNNELVTAIGFANESTRKQRNKLEQVYRMIFRGIQGLKSNKIEIQEIQNFGDIPQHVFNAMTVTQKEDYMQKVYAIDPDPQGHMMPNEIIEVEEDSTTETIEENANEPSND